MGREIKFRGLRSDGKGWIRGSLLIKNDQYFIVSLVKVKLRRFGKIREEYREFEVTPLSVGQFTGLTDKNGKEIYEGDVFAANEYPFVDNGKPNYNGVVFWVFTGFQYRLTLVNKDKIGISEGINEVLEDGSWIEVIGNIHEK